MIVEHHKIIRNIYLTSVVSNWIDHIAIAILRESDVQYIILFNKKANYRCDFVKRNITYENAWTFLKVNLAMRILSLDWISNDMAIE